MYSVLNGLCVLQLLLFYVVFPEETTESKTDDKDTSLEELNSSIIKFCLTEATPYRKR